MGWREQILFCTVLLVCLHVCISDESNSEATERRENSRVVTTRARSRCVSCIVNGQVFKGHSRFAYEDGCERFRCICWCNGTYECPPQYTQQICDDDNTASGANTETGVAGSDQSSSASSSSSSSSSSSPSSSSSSSSSRETASSSRRRGRGRGRCVNCVVNGKEHPGHSYFNHVEQCLIIRNCICYCNGSWVCPKERAENTCMDNEETGSQTGREARGETPDTSYSSNNQETVESEANEDDSDDSQTATTPEPDNDNRRTRTRRPTYRGCQNCTVDGQTFKGNAYFELLQGCAKFRYCACYCNGSWECPERFASSLCEEGSDKKTGEPTQTPDVDTIGSRRRPGGGCSSCEVKGQTFPGNQYFNIKDGCIEYRNCACYCNGSWSCPDDGARNVCREDETRDGPRTSRCQECEVNNQTYRGNSYFDTTDGCFEYKSCVCRCDGSWDCPSNRARNICQDEDRETDRGTSSTDDRTSTCRSCVVKGETYPGNNYFSRTEGCIEYNSCACYCNGTWSCPASRARNICDEEEARPQTCNECTVYDETFPGGTVFNFNRGCTQYNNCQCNCNGTWNCPAESSVNICQNNSTDSTDATDRNGGTTGCAQCSAYGQLFEGGNYFDVVSGCISYKNCICRCDGSWQCSERYAERICDDEEETGGGRQQRCRDCMAMDKRVEGNSRFELVDGCTEYKNCICRCDGTWECPSQFARNICTEEERPTDRPSTRCSECTPQPGKVVPGNSYFDLRDGCNQFSNCRCNCDGTWDCSAENARNVCSEEENIRQGNCQECHSRDGRRHAPNTNFRMTHDCVEYTDCQCRCNGSWSCSGESAKWVCTDRCTQCLVEGRRYEGNTRFPLKTGCLEYTCDCFCNGSYVCPGSTVRNTCPVGVRNNCNKCTVEGVGGEPDIQYEGESDFTLRKDCVMYQCRCNCDGSWNCPGEDARNVCRGERLGGCRSCVVSDTEYYRGNSEFSLRKDCLQYECKCNCDGSWECPGERARNICEGEVPGGCRNCRLDDGTVHRANSEFSMRQGCLHYTCQCNCDGSWNCPGADARDVCRGEVPGGCRSCVVSESEYYQARSTFPLVQNCNNYLCTCNCNGSYNCVWQSRSRNCREDPRRPRTNYRPQTILPVLPRSQESRTQGTRTQVQRIEDTRNQETCNTCKVSASEEFAGRSRFTLDRGCLRYSCECNCDGSWKCPVSRTTRTCEERDCEPCKVGLEEYPGKSTFFYTRICHQFTCECQCGGRWTCNYRNSTNICKERQGVAVEREDRRDYRTTTASPVETRVTAQSGHSDLQPGIHSSRPLNPRDRTHTVNYPSTNTYRCRKCYIEEEAGSMRTIEPNEAFSFSRGCQQYENCLCKCDGRWQCAQERNICDNAGRSNTDRTGDERREGTQTDVSSSTWVYAGGVNRSKVITSDDRTGGGYTQVQIDTRYLPTYTQVGRNRDPRLQSLDTPSSTPDDTSGSHSVNTGGIDRCTPCQADTRTYPAGASFDMRRGCVIYKCLCLCGGNYRCRLVPDNQCSVNERQGSCSNCLYNGMVFPGNMSFTVRDGCAEKECKCSCDGTHTCDTNTPIPNCTPGVGLGVGAYMPIFPGGAMPMYPGGYPGGYPVPGGFQRVSQTHMTSSGRPVYFSSCPTCDGSPGRRVVYHMPVHPASGGPLIRHSTGVLPSGAEFIPPGYGTQGCIQCLVDNVLRDGNSTFSFTKDCVEFDCYCGCSGGWKCAGRMSPLCTPGVGPSTGYNPDTVPHERTCRTCVVEGTEYPANSRFSLRKGCSEYKCTCNCDGGWVCPNQQPTNICPTETNTGTRSRAIDPLVVRETELVADQAVSSFHDEDVDNDEKSSKKMEEMKIPTKCANCQVRGVVYPGNSKFFLRNGCIQNTCQCHCDGNWECPEEESVDICKVEDDESANADEKCSTCRIKGDVYRSGQEFQIESGCFRLSCQCHCNGTYSCPSERTINTCDPKILPSPEEIKRERLRLPYGADRHVTISPANSDIAANTNNNNGCKQCRVNQHTIKSMDTYIRHAGCFESVCHCDCSGKPLCPPTATVNVCKLKDKKPIGERKGCRVGKNTYYTRVFARVKDCVQRTCICHDNGMWTCKKSTADRRVC